MTPQELKSARQRRGWSQHQAAVRLGVSQSYLAMLEGGKRRLTPLLARRFMRVYRLPPTVLPPSEPLGPATRVDAQTLAQQLAALGYPGFAYLRPYSRKRNPAEVLLIALAQDNLEARLVEALPWLLLHYWDLDANWLVAQAKSHNLQNRLGFVVSLARSLSERARVPDERRTQALTSLEVALDRSRLAGEDTLCKATLSERERQWLRENRPEEARRWNLLTDWRAENLSYAV